MTVTGYYQEYWSVTKRDEAPAWFLDLLGATIPRGGRYLDYGCGDGVYLGRWLSARAEAYVGVDVSQAAVDRARSFGLDARVIDEQGTLPFTDNSFDTAVSVEVLEHLFRPDLAAAEIRRILRPGGTLFATVPNVAYWRRRLDLALLGRWNPLGDERSVNEPWRDPHVRFFSVTALRSMLARSGYEHVHVGGHGGGVLCDLPVPARVRRRRASSAYRRLEAYMPAMLGARLHVVARKPGEPYRVAAAS